MKKRLFQVLDEMNQHDSENGTRLVQLCPDVIEMNELKKGMQVKMGAPIGAISINKVMQGKQRVVMMVIDGDEYDKRIKSETE
jgi:hypothetical protein